MFKPVLKGLYIISLIGFVLLATHHAVIGQDMVYKSGVFLKQAGTNWRQVVYDIESDAAGNTYICGGFEGTIDFNPNGVTTNLTSFGATDAFLAKYDTSSVLVWVKHMGRGPGDDLGMVLAIDEDSSALIVAGSSGDWVDIDPTAGLDSIGESGKYYGYLARYDLNGNRIWGKGYVDLSGYAEPFYCPFQELQITKAGDIITAGFVYLPGAPPDSVNFDFDNNIASHKMPASNLTHSIFIASHTLQSGSYNWHNEFNDPANSWPIIYGIELDANDNIVVVGQFNSATLDFDPGIGVANLAKDGSQNDGFLARYNGSTGIYIDCYNVAKIPNAGQAHVQDIAINKTTNDIYITGGYTSKEACDFDPGVGVANLPIIPSGGSRYFATKFTSGAAPGSVSFSNVYFLDKTSTSQIKLADNGNVFIAGYLYTGTSDMDPGAGVVNRTSLGSFDCFISIFQPDMTFIHVSHFGSASSDALYAIEIVGNTVYSAGQFNNTLDFDPDGGTHNESAIGNPDAFFTKSNADATLISLLPIELLSLTASSLNENETLIEWSTSSELNNDYFTIERSENTKDWKIIGTVDGAGNSNNTRYYNYIDESPPSGVSYYRLKQTDYNGDFEYSKIVAVKIEKDNVNFSIHPNPLRNESLKLFIQGIKDNEYFNVSILDGLGRRVYSRGIIAETNKNGNMFVEIENKLIKGQYMVNVTSESTSFSEHLIVE